jgi:tRNA threonylcarbamoyladenosine biosynthesis protein TsaB
MSWILGIDTSSTDLGIGLYHDAEPVASYSRYLKNSHAEHIEQAVTLMLQGNKVPPGAVTHIAITVGPGSFTGLRIGLAFVKGFCANGGAVGVLPVSSLCVLAHGGIPRAMAHGSIVAAIDARRDEVFWARFSCSGTGIVRETPDAMSPVRNFMGSVRNDDILVTDTMGYAGSTVFQVLADRKDVLPVERFPLQRGLCCARIGAMNQADPAAWKKAMEVLPEYLRSFTPPVRRKAGEGTPV